MIHIFGRGAFGRPEASSLIQTNGTQSLAKELGHRSPVPVEVMSAVYKPFMPGLVLDPFMGTGSALLAARMWGGEGIGIEIEERYCEIAAHRLEQEPLL